MSGKTTFSKCLGAVVILISLAAGRSEARAAVEYDLLDLISVPAHAPDHIYPYTPGDINDLGQVTGHGYLVQDRWVGDSHFAHPFFYDPIENRVVNLGDMAGGFGETGHSGNGYAVNNGGWVTGRNSDDTGHYAYHAYLWRDDNGNGVTDPGDMRDLGGGSPSQTGRGLNNSCRVVGTVSGPDWMWTDADGDYEYDDGEKVYFDYSPTDINDAGQVIMRGGTPKHAYRWTDDGNGVVATDELATIFNMLGGDDDDVVVSKINNAGQVAGYMKNSSDGKQGYLWTDTDGDNVAEDEEFAFFGINDKNTYIGGLSSDGTIVGGTYHWGGSRRAYIWDEADGMRDLNELIEQYELDGHNGAFLLSQAYGINELGQIVVCGWFDDNGNGKQNTNEQDHVIVLTPRAIPEPSTVTLLVAGSFVALLTLWKRHSSRRTGGC